MSQATSSTQTLNTWARSNKGAAEFANAFGSEVADLFGYMCSDGLSAENSADLIKELVGRVLTGQLAQNFTDEVSAPATPMALINRQE